MSFKLGVHLYPVGVPQADPPHYPDVMPLFHACKITDILGSYSTDGYIDVGSMLTEFLKVGILGCRIPDII